MTWYQRYQQTLRPRPGTSTVMRRGSLNLNSRTQILLGSLYVLPSFSKIWSGSWTFSLGLASRSLGFPGNGLVESCWAVAASDNPATAATARPQRQSRMPTTPAMSLSSMPGELPDRCRSPGPRGLSDLRPQDVSRAVVITAAGLCGQAEAAHGVPLDVGRGRERL